MTPFVNECKRRLWHVFTGLLHFKFGLECENSEQFRSIESYPELLNKTHRLVMELHSPFGNLREAMARLQCLGFTLGTIAAQTGAVRTCYFTRE